MTKSQQYDQQKQETADRFREMDAVDEVLADIKGLMSPSLIASDVEILVGVIEDVEESIHYNESLEYILTLIPDTIKERIIARGA